MTINWIPEDFNLELLVWQTVYDEVMAKAKELGGEDTSIDVEIKYEGIVPAGPDEGKKVVGVSRKDQELGRTGERFLY